MVVILIGDRCDWAEVLSDGELSIVVPRTSFSSYCRVENQQKSRLSPLKPRLMSVISTEIFCTLPSCPFCFTTGTWESPDGHQLTISTKLACVWDRLGPPPCRTAGRLGRSLESDLLKGRKGCILDRLEGSPRSKSRALWCDVWHWVQQWGQW